MKDDIADDTEWPLKVISGTVNGFIVCVSTITSYTECPNKSDPLRFVINIAWK